MLLPPKIDMNEIIFGSLRFMRKNAFVFRKYYFLPLFFSIIGLFAQQVPWIGMTAGVVCQSIAMGLISVSVSRYYFIKNADEVAEGAQIPFARTFFLTFMMAALAQVSNIFPDLPEAFNMVIPFTVAVYLWFNLKITLIYPALAMDEGGSFKNVLSESYANSTGHLLKIIYAGIICYVPVVFFLMMLSNVVETQQLLENFWANIPHLIFVDVIFIFCYMWFTLSIARLYEASVLAERSRE